MRVRLYKRTKDNLSYFQFLSDDDQAILNSQGYQDKDARNNGVRSVIANADNPARYDRQTSADGKPFFILRAGNNQEIARSVEFDTAAAMEAAIASCTAEIPNIGSDGQSKAAEAAPADTASNPYRGEDGDDNYRRLSFYQERISGAENGFDTFATEEGNFYFTLNQGGQIALISESYTSQSGRNNGVDSVTRNLPIAERYQRSQHPNGKHYFNLLAGNNQEIATSRWFDSEADMNAVISALQRGRFGETQAVIMTEAGSGGEGLEGMDDYRASVEIADAPPPAKEVSDKPKKKRKKAKRKPKAEKVIVGSGSYLFNDVSYETMRSANEKYYFSFRTAEGKSLMLSTNIRGYESEAEVDAAVQRVLEFGPYEGNYEGKTTKNGKYYFYLNDTDGNRVAKSFFYDTPEEMQDAIGLLIGRGIVAVAAPKAPEAAPASRVVDEYLPCEAYAGGAKGFHKFEHEGEWYFSWNDANGNTILRSEGYKSEGARDNGIESVKKNSPNQDRWSKVEENGKYYWVLKAGNYQEIGRSCPYDDETAALGALRAAAGALWVPPPAPKAAPAPVVLDEYLPCAAYAGGARGFHKFEHEGEWYFSWNDDKGNTILRSQGYKSEAARDNGIESVKKNSPNQDRWSKVEENGKYYWVLKAGNHQEIGRSCPYDDETAALGALRAAAGALWVPPPAPKAAPAPVVLDEYLPCAAYAGGARGFHKFEHEGEWYFSWNDEKGNTILRSQGYKSEAARDNGIESVKKNSPDQDRWSKVEEESKCYWVLKAGNHQEIGRSCPYDDETAALGAVVAAAGALWVPPPAPRILDAYLPCAAYAGGSRGFHKFEHEGEWYFSWNDEKGNTILRSQGYKSEAARDNGIESVKKNSPDQDRWSKVEEDGKCYWVLKAGNHQEIGRSCPYDDETAALGAVVAAAGALWIPPPAPKVPSIPAVIDDYLPCEDYGHNEEGFFRFKKDGEYYFGYNDKNGKTILRSEGYKSEKARENGIESVKKNSPNKERWEKMEEAGKYYYILKAANGQEIARSCYYSDKGAMLAGFGVLGALFALPAVIPTPPVVATPPPPPPKKVATGMAGAAAVGAGAAAAVAGTAAAVSGTAKAAPPPPTPTAGSGGGSGRFPWWLLALLGLLLLLALMWWKGCFGCNPDPVTPGGDPPITVVDTPDVGDPPVVVDTPDVVDPPVVPPTSGCSCTGNENPIFNIPTGTTPKSLRRLGTLPEFGDSHGLDAAGFLDKLTDAYNGDYRDRRFLDALFRGMGYENGFAAAKRSMFSEVALPVGTKGNMGYSHRHLTSYASLDVKSGRDQEAYRIQAKNGCHMHFMKTCGNHFFICPN